MVAKPLFSPTAAIVAPAAGYGTVLPVNGTTIDGLAVVARPAASGVLLTLDPSHPYSAFVLHLPSVIGTMHALGS